MERPLRALGGLLRRAGDRMPSFFFETLDLLRHQVHADQVVLARHDGEKFDATWWVPEEPEPELSQALCRWILDNPGRTLHLRDAARDRLWGGHPEMQGLGAVLGTATWEGPGVAGVLLAHCRSPRTFTRPQVGLLHTVAGTLGKALEVELLKQDLRRMREALALSAAVLEDSALQDPQTDLPNRRYLDIWLKANLYMARRRGERLACVRWDQPEREFRILKPVADSLRGEDLLVCEGQGRCLMLLPRTPKGGALLLVHRLRQRLGELPMAATHWDPEQDDLDFHSTRTRLEEALARPSVQAGRELVWLEE